MRPIAALLLALLLTGCGTMPLRFSFAYTNEDDQRFEIGVETGKRVVRAMRSGK
jgi:hypothetical protein